MPRRALALVAFLCACSETSAPVTHPAATVVVTPDSISIGIGHTVQMTAVVRDSSGTSITDRPISWKTSDTTLATITSAGLVTGHAGGQVTITASVDSATGFATLIVLTRVGFVFVSPDTNILVPGGSIDLTVTLRGPSFEVLSDRFVTWTVGDSTIVTVTADGQVKGLQIGTTTLRAHSEGVSSTPALVSVKTPVFSRLTSGPEAQHTCAITPVGSAYCWGYNYDGELGVAVTDRDYGAPFGKPFPAGITNPQTFFAATPGDYFTCALAGSPASGVALCWGGGADGTLGNGDVSSSLTPALVSTTVRFTAVRSGWNHTCAIATDSTAYCWGRPPGIGTTIPGQIRAFTPVPVDGGLHFRVLGAGAHLTCGLTTDSLAYCWGYTIGNDTASGDPGPHLVSGSLKYATLAVGDGHACGVAADGVTYCWGRNSSGQLGNGTTDTATAPVPIAGGVSFVSLVAGHSTTCGLTALGVAYCWGNNGFGQLGRSSSETCSSQACSTTPAPVSGGLTFQTLAAGRTHACGLTAGSVAYCWGANDAGQVGDGTFLSRTAPTRVAGQP